MDVLYCGVDKDKILNAKPKLNIENFELFLHYIYERQQVAYRKEVLKLPKPWTSDPILSNYRFTNVRREDDKVTKEIIRLVCHNDSLSYEDKLYNVVLFRAYNNPETLKSFGFPKNNVHLIDVEMLKDSLRNYVNSETNRSWFSNAYFQSGAKNHTSRITPESEREPLIPLRFLHYIEYIRSGDIITKIKEAKNQKEITDYLQTLPGVAKFMSYQIFIDFTYIKEFPFSEKEFTISGPGCSRGIEYLFTDRDGMNDEECIFWLRDELTKDYYKEFLEKTFTYHTVKTMTIMSIENCLCEISKYLKAYYGKGRPKNVYRG